MEIYDDGLWKDADTDASGTAYFYTKNIILLRNSKWLFWNLSFFMYIMKKTDNYNEQNIPTSGFR